MKKRSGSFDIPRSDACSHRNLPIGVGCPFWTQKKDVPGEFVPIFEGCKNCCCLRSLKRISGKEDKGFSKLAREVLVKGRRQFNSKVLSYEPGLEKISLMEGSEAFRWIFFFGDPAGLEDEILSKLIDRLNVSKVNHEVLLTTKGPRQLGKQLYKATNGWEKVSDKIILGYSLSCVNDKDKEREFKQLGHLLSIPKFKKEIWIAPLLGDPTGIERFIAHPDVIRVKVSPEISGHYLPREEQAEWTQHIKELCDKYGKKFVETKVYDNETNGKKTRTCYANAA